MELFLVALAVSALFLTAVYVLERLGPFAVCALALFVAVLGLCAFAPMMLVLGLLAFLICPLAYWLAPERPHICTWAAAVALVVTWVWSVGAVWHQWREAEDIVASHPLESLAPRLVYEQRPGREEQPLPQITSRMEARLELRDQSNEDSLFRHRVRVLEELHSGVRLKFVTSAGFGVARGPRAGLWSVRLPDYRPTPLPRPSDPSATPEPGPLAAAGSLPSITPDKLLEWHTRGEREFVDRERNGYIRSRDQVAGFVPHRFGYLPSEDDHWQVVRLELISLLKHERPVAYVSENLPDMSQVEKYPTRELDAFEASALAKLRTEEDLVVDEQPSRIRMVGSLRAGKTCLECHSVQRGELLGAFTYLLERKSRPPAKPATPPREPSA